MPNGGSAAVATPSVTIISMSANVPASAGSGVPCNRPVPKSKLAHAGLFSILNVSGVPSGSVAAGANEY